MSEINSQGCTEEMIERLRYCKRVLKKVWDLVEEEKSTWFESVKKEIFYEEQTNK